MDAFCAGSDAQGDARRQCDAWGLRKPPSIPEFVAAARENWDGLEKCKFMLDGMVRSDKASFTKVPRNLRAQPNQVMEALEQVQAMVESASATGAGKKVRELHQAHEDWKKLNEVASETREIIEAADKFIHLVNEVTPTRLLAIGAFGSPQPELMLCAGKYRGGSEEFNRCYSDAIKRTPAATKAAAKFSEYMHGLDVSQCLRASGAVAAAMSR